jgi:2-dehydro-3-deoxyphosphogluconate aldolase / (4S)-4-hydroxy-2-oxoglutarate aldolase
MHKHGRFIERIVRQGVLPLYYNADVMISTQIMGSLYEAGIRIIEYTNRGDQAFKNLKQLKKTCSRQYPDMAIGMGTVTDKKAADKAISAGADFLVSPGYADEILEIADKENICWIPGCMTPSDLITVKNAGLQLVKLFPANVLGTAFVKAVKEVFPELLFMPTGGVEEGNLENWFKAGVSAVGMGGSLMKKEIILNNDFGLLKQNTESIMHQIASIRLSDE